MVKRASISSKKTMEGACSLACLNSSLMMRSLSPTHFERMSATLRLKKVRSFSVAMAFARRVLPHPGGPYIRMPFGGVRWTAAKSSGSW